jgi:ABC-type bacteriocin/lantibiotic exporter with double-glycine peptidase domain
MVLSTLGCQVDEARLRQLADCSPFGTNAFQLIEAARHLGFSNSCKHTLASLEELGELIEQGFFPIVYIDLWPVKGGVSGQQHALVVLAVEAEKVIVLDPFEGERELTHPEFLAAWREMRFLTIVIEK